MRGVRGSSPALRLAIVVGVSDVVEGGRPPDTRWPMRWGLVAAAVVLAAVLVAVQLFSNGGHGHHHATAPTSPVVTPSPAPQTSAVIVPGPTTSAPPWPTASSACDYSVDLPQLIVAPGTAAVSGAVLVGGAGVWQITASGGAAQLAAVRGLPARGSDATLVRQLVGGPGATYAQIATGCGNSLLTSHDYRIDGGVATRLAVNGFLVGGVHHTWNEDYATPASASGGGAASGTVLTPLDGGTALTLPPHTTLVADTSAGLVVARQDPAGAGTPPSIEVLDPNTGAARRPLVNGYPHGATATIIVVGARDCPVPPAAPCTLAEIGIATGRTLRLITLPAGTSPATADFTFSADGTLSAFPLYRGQHDPRFATGHPGGPEDVAVVDLHSGKLSIVPGIELAPKTQPGLAFDANDTLLIAVSEGTHGQLLQWRPGASQAAQVATLPGPLIQAPSLLAVPTTTPS